MSRLGILLLMAAVLGSLNVALAQQVILSDPQKLSSKTPNLRILGKNDQGVIIYKFGKGTDIVEAYNERLVPRWTQTLSIKQENSSIKDIYLFPTYSIAYFIAQDKEETVLYAQILDSKFKSGGKFLAADTIAGSRYEIETRMKTVTSQNQEHLVTYYPQYTNNKLEYVQVVALNNKLDVLYKGNLKFPLLDDNYVLVNVQAANKDVVYFLFEDVERSKRRYSGDGEFVMYRLETSTGLLSRVYIDLEKPLYGFLSVSLDNVNQQVSVGGFYSNDDRKEAMGYFFKTFDILTGAVERSQYAPFSNEILYQIVGKDTTRRISGLYSYKLSDFVMRHDGGVLLIAESRYNNVETDNSSAFVPAAGPNFRTVNVYYYNDILVISLKPNGELDWFNVLRKKQVSEDDDGFFSGYCMLTANNKLRFVYNEEIYYKTNVNEFTVDAKGVSNRSHIFNAGMRDIMLAPTLGKQISGNEILVPSFRNRSIRFVKLQY